METITATKTTVNPYAKTARPGVVKILQLAGGNPFRYAFGLEKMFEKELNERSGYERKTTFVSDFCLAEPFGDDAVRDSYRRMKKSWLRNYEYATELALATNWLSWFWAYNDEPELSTIYADAYHDITACFYLLYDDVEGDKNISKKTKLAAREYFFEWTD